MAAQEEKYIDGKIWARIWAKALLEPEFKVKLETDPVAAVRAFKEQAKPTRGGSRKGGGKGEKAFPGLPSYDVLYDLEDIDTTVGKKLTRDPTKTPGEGMAHGFRRMSYEQLQAIIRGDDEVLIENSELIHVEKSSRKTKAKK